MSASSGFPTAATFPAWTLLFARQPEPDLELDEVSDDLDDTIVSKGSRSPKKSSSKGPLLLLLLLIVAVGGYFAMDPEGFMTMIGMAEPEPAPVAMPAPRPTPPPPAPAAPAPAPTPAAPAPAPGAVAPPPAPPTPAPAAPSPKFGEGQVVVALADPAAPGGAVTLTVDSAGSKPGPTVRPGEPLTVLDGELRGNTTWVYSVRTGQGTKGWIQEARLKSK